ncbi:hypothetical protein ODJ79_24750 [Actinoplanes sp. KI2]|uniref:hypothetical protein n=1 Tax=Actinoplanes sp. KI2 TaxID=2983315 RepID=UPI0021D5DE4C|nr:hypothetical protein [Actinoplanes sp. KI2]MCU7726949.1 hypothetical protein [Actinoplanes sp. KI2]
MLRFRYKALRAATALVLGIGLTTPIAAPAANAAAGQPGPIQLQNALLTAADLPKGYLPHASSSTRLVSNVASDTNICDHKIPQSHVNLATTSFIRVPGPMMFETLSETGPSAARAIVAAIATAPRLCRNVHNVRGSAIAGNLHLSANLHLTALRVPRLGDASAALAFTVRPAGLNTTVQGKLISVARGSVTVTILLLNTPRNDQRELNLIATTAVRKLDRVL